MKTRTLKQHDKGFVFLTKEQFDPMQAKLDAFEAGEWGDIAALKRRAKEPSFTLVKDGKKPACGLSGHPTP